MHDYNAEANRHLVTLLTFPVFKQPWQSSSLSVFINVFLCLHDSFLFHWCSVSSVPLVDCEGTLTMERKGGEKELESTIIWLLTVIGRVTIGIQHRVGDSASRAPALTGGRKRNI